MKFNLYTRAIIPALLLCLSACSSNSPAISNGEFFANSMITAKIKSRLVDDPLTGMFHIDVFSRKGVVRLSGTVKTPNEKQRAEVIAYSVEGVKKVDNGLEISQTE